MSIPSAYQQMRESNPQMLDDLKHFLKTPNWRRQHGWRRAVWQAMNEQDDNP